MASRKRYLEQESHAEVRAVIEVGNTSSNGILRFHMLPIVWSSRESKKNRQGKILKVEDVNVRGQDIFSNVLWDRFLTSKGYINATLISLTDDTERLTEELYSFLVNGYAVVNDRYDNLDVEGKVWLRKVIRLSVIYHLMENKLAGYMQSLESEADDEDYMCSDFAVFCYKLIRVSKLTQENTAREIHHIVKEPDKADQYIQKIFDKHYELLYQQLGRIDFPHKEAILRVIRPDVEEAI